MSGAQAGLDGYPLAFIERQEIEKYAHFTFVALKISHSLFFCGAPHNFNTWAHHLCYYFRFKKGVPAINIEFTYRERERFRNLLELAKSSKFDGERTNAMAAATRLATKHGLSLEEAARFQGASAQVSAPRPERTGGDDAKVKTVRRDMPKIGRNDPCPCGSGKKYKHCHGQVQ